VKILHVVPTYLPAVRYGGPIYAVHGLCRALTRLGHEVHVFTTNVDGDRDSEVPLGRPVNMEGVQVRYFPSKNLRDLYWSPAMRTVLAREVRSYELLHLHSVFRWPTHMAAGLARRHTVPYVLAPRGMLVKDLLRRKSMLAKWFWIRCFEKRNLAGASAIHATSVLEAEEIRKFHFNLPKIFVVPNGIDTDESLLSEKEPLSKTPPFILFLGRVNWKKGLDRLIEALARVPEARLTVAGNDEEGYQARLEQLARSLGVSERVKFTGPVYEKNKSQLLRSASFLALPSYSENFGNAVLEAMAVGCPVMVTPQVGVAEIVRNAGAGEVVEADPEALAAAIRRMLFDAEKRSRMGQAGRRLIQEHFRWEKVAVQMTDVYRAVSGRA
jgi:glycosyltransferase involved in cell wall biosynthesis